MNVRNLFAKNLNFLLTQKKCTQAELAQFMRVSTASISDWRNGKTIPRIDRLQRLSDFFLVMPEELTHADLEKKFTRQNNLSSADADSWTLLTQLFRDDPETLNILKRGKLTANGISLDDSIYPMTDEDKLLLKGLIKKIVREVKNGATRVEIHRKD